MSKVPEEFISALSLVVERKDDWEQVEERAGGDFAVYASTLEDRLARVEELLRQGIDKLTEGNT